MKLALAHFDNLLSTQNVGHLSDTLARVGGINTSIKYNRAIHPPSYNEKAKKDEEEEGNTKTNTRFDEWFDAMPLFHGYRPGRDDCLKEWNRQQLDAVADEVIEATKRFKRSRSWRDGYNPMPITYLKKKRWLDAPPEEEDFFVAS